MAEAMQITKIETIRLSEHPNLLWVQLHASDGTLGLGETFYIPGAVEAVIHDFAAPLLLGKSAFDREQHWLNLFSSFNFFGCAGAEMRAVSALDIALWDLLGKYLGQPVHNLMGGKCRDFIPVYNTCVNTPKYADQDDFLAKPSELARSLLADGFTQMKVWPWDRFAPQINAFSTTGPAGWSAMGPPGHLLAPAQLKEGLWVVQEIRKAVGDRIEVAIEGHSRWDLNCAIRIARSLEPYDIIWMEDIIQPDSARDLQRLVRETRVPQCVSERLFSKFAYRQILEERAAHIAMIDLVWTGGLTEAAKIAALADAYHMAFTTHDCTGPISLVAALHLCAAMPNAMIAEVVRGFCAGYYLDLLDRPVTIKEGKAWFDFGPGLGVKLRPEVTSRPGATRRVSAL
jgi:galactonate dehydratase